jgi:hypothetical protein
MAVFPSIACTVATTSRQLKPDAETKKGVSAFDYRSKSSRVGVSSSNLKIFFFDPLLNKGRCLEVYKTTLIPLFRGIGGSCKATEKRFCD